MGLKEVELTLTSDYYVQEEFRRFLERLKRSQRNERIEKETLLEEKRFLAHENRNSLPDGELQLLFAQCLVLDLLLQGWFLKKKGGKLHLAHRNGLEELPPIEIKEKIRNSHLLARDFQLQEPSVVDFIERMERRRFTAKGWVSIFSLMRDGEELARSLKDVRIATEGDADLVERLKGVIDPYIQFVEPDKKCEHTDLYLSDIWRYFRHTWITEYKSLPGRSMSILIRDAAAEFHPIIGIAALGSSMAQLTRRDEWIGWEAETFVRNLIDSATERELTWINNTLEGLLQDIFIGDLLQENSLTKDELIAPSEEVIAFLKKRSEHEKELHIKFPHEAKKTKEGESLNWAERAQTHLFKSKRFGSLAELLQIKKLFIKYQISNGVDNLKNALRSSEFKNAVGRLVRRHKAQRVGIDMMDIIICGSVAPYNHLLGGKLVCLLLSSPEVSDYYNQKYGRKESLIASAMAGKPVVRKPNLVFLATTSLYGVGSSQYNRIKMPRSFFGEEGPGGIEYINLGISEGFGSFHFSKQTIISAHYFLGRRKGGRRVNSIFGEGANPLIRKLREAIELIGLDSEPLLRHENKRIIYGIPLAKNTREVLLGFEKKPAYYIPTSFSGKEATSRIAEFWAVRWLLNRIKNHEVLDRVRENSKAYPITHGARVPLYQLKQDGSGLFENY